MRVSVDGDAIVGFGAAVDTGWCLMLVGPVRRPERLGTGIGRPLLDAVFGDADGAGDLRLRRSARRPALRPGGDDAAVDELLPRRRRQATAARRARAPRAHGPTRRERRPGAGLERRGPHDRPRVLGRRRRRATRSWWRTPTGPWRSATRAAGRSAPSRVLDRLVVRPEADPVAPALAGHPTGRPRQPGRCGCTSSVRTRSSRSCWRPGSGSWTATSSLRAIPRSWIRSASCRTRGCCRPAQPTASRGVSRRRTPCRAGQTRRAPRGTPRRGARPGPRSRGPPARTPRA